jgi:hypothetical protein
MKLHSIRTTLAVIACTFLGSSLAFAQASRTWVSGLGNDADPCSRTAPCRTFAGAITKTATGGEISVLDPGGYGTVAITKPITISGVGEQASILAAEAPGIVINITLVPRNVPNTVTLRNIQINGFGGDNQGTNGIRVLGATKVVLDTVNIFGFGTSGILAEDTSEVVIHNSVLSNIGGKAVHATDSSTITVENSQLVANNIAVQSDAGAEIRLSNNGVYNNRTGFACGTGGALLTAGNNRKAGNVGGAVPVCDPTGTITIQ